MCECLFSHSAPVCHRNKLSEWESVTVCSHRLKKKRRIELVLCAAGQRFLSWDLFLGHEWHSHTVAVFCWAWPVNPFSWITWCSLTRSRSSWWPRRSDPCTCRLPPPLPSSLCWCPPRHRTAALSTSCRCQSPSRSRCRDTTRSRRAPDSRTSLCTLALHPALDQVQVHFVVYRPKCVSSIKYQKLASIKSCLSLL